MAIDRQVAANRPYEPLEHSGAPVARRSTSAFVVRAAHLRVCPTRQSTHEQPISISIVAEVMYQTGRERQQGRRFSPAAVDEIAFNIVLGNVFRRRIERLQPQQREISKRQQPL
jgi:hypothetical protein